MRRIVGEKIIDDIKYADVLIVWVGTNDLNENVQPKDIVKAYQFFLGYLALMMPSTKILLLPIFPRNDSKVKDQKRKKVNRLTKKLLREPRFKRVSFMKTERIFETSQKRKNKGDQFSVKQEFYRLDGLHLNDRGIERLHRYIMQYIKENLSADPRSKIAERVERANIAHGLCTEETPGDRSFDFEEPDVSID
ncbi:uncharacterized protein LOC141906112 [Tubulanus polymorphus]